MPNVDLSFGDLCHNLGDISACGLLDYVDLAATLYGERSLGNWAGDLVARDMRAERAELGLGVAQQS